MKVLAVLAITCGLVAAAAKAPEGDAVFRIFEDDDGAAFEHDQFWTDRETNEVEGRFAFVTPEGRELETRYSAGLNGFTADGDHLPVAVEDTAAVAEARASFMAYMIELMAEQKEGEANVQVEKLEDEGAMNLGQRNDFLDGDIDVIEGASRRKRAPEARNGYYQMDEMESRSSGMVDFAHDDFEDQLAMPSMSYSSRIQPMRYYGAAKKHQMAAAAATSRSGSVYPTDPYNFASKVPMNAAATFFYRPAVPTGMTKSTTREKTISMMPVKAPLNKYTVPASTYYPFQQKQQQVATRVVPYMPGYQNMFAKMPTYKMPTYPTMVAKRPVVVGYPTQFQHPYQPMSYAAKPKAQEKSLKKTVYSSSYQPQMSSKSGEDHKFSAMPAKKVLTKMPYFSYSLPAKTVAQTKTKTTEDIYKSYSIPMKPAEKQQQNIFSYQGFNRPMMSHSHYPMYPFASGTYHPSGFMAPGRVFRGNGVAATLPGQVSPPGVMPTVPVPGTPVKPIPQAPGNAPDNYPGSPARPIPQVPGNSPDYYPAGSPPQQIPQAPAGSHPGHYPAVPARPIPQAPAGSHPGNYPAVPAMPIPQAPGSYPVVPVKPIPQAPGNSPDYYPAGSPPQPIPQAPVTVPGGDHPHHAGHGPDSATGDRPQGEHSQHGSVPNIPEVDQPAAILF